MLRKALFTDDKCPADGFGAHLDMRVYFGTGSAYASRLASDERDCEAKPAKHWGI